MSLRRVADTIRRSTPQTDLIVLARMIIFAVGIGNLDLHTKNLGLLHPVDEEVHLAPTYDAIPQTHQQNDGKLALAINRKYRHNIITRDDLVSELTTWGLRGAKSIIDETLEQLSEAIRAESPMQGAFSGLQDQLLTYITNLLDDRPVGETGST